MPSDLARKLFYRGGPAVVLGAPPGYGLGVETVRADAAPLAFALAFVTTTGALRQTVWPLLANTVADPVVWVTYPKVGSGVPSDLNRDVLRGLVEAETAFGVVTNVAVDATWSALRLRPKARIKRRA